jgi:anti-sigma factor ChrR (cupin superfamily)
MAATAVRVWFDEDCLCVALADGRTICTPLEWFPRLRDATPAQRANWRLIANGVGINWPDVDEDLSVGGMLAG